MFSATRVCLRGSDWKTARTDRFNPKYLPHLQRQLAALPSTSSPSPFTQPTQSTKFKPSIPRRFRPTAVMAAASFGYPLPGHRRSNPSPQRRPLGLFVRDQITPPSLESGGIPDPSLDYLALASHPPLQLRQPRNLLVVIDLNGTLLHRITRKKPVRFVERPYAREFLSYCINTFTVVIWSSARPENVETMCTKLVKHGDLSKIVALWNRDRFHLTASEYNRRVQCYKRLEWLWDDPVIRASAPKGEEWTQLNTVLIDDSLEKGRSEPYNLLQLPEFIGQADEPGFILPQVHDYLNECSRQENVSAFIKSQPFKIKPGFTL